MNGYFYRQMNSASGHCERLHREIALRIRPGGKRGPAGTARQSTKGFDRVLVAALGVDGLAGAELDLSAANMRGLTLAAGEVHFHPPALAIVECLVAEVVEIEVSAKLAVDAHEQVEIESRRHACGIVIGGVENARFLHKIDAEDEDGARPQHASGMAQERRRIMRLEIANGRAGKESRPSEAGNLWRKAERLGEIRGDRKHRKARIVAGQFGCLLSQHLRRDVDRHIGSDRWRRIEQDARLSE